MLFSNRPTVTSDYSRHQIKKASKQRDLQGKGINPFRPDFVVRMFFHNSQRESLPTLEKRAFTLSKGLTQHSSDEETGHFCISSIPFAPFLLCKYWTLNSSRAHNKPTVTSEYSQHHMKSRNSVVLSGHVCISSIPFAQFLLCGLQNLHNKPTATSENSHHQTNSTQLDFQDTVA